VLTVFLEAPAVRGGPPANTDDRCTEPAGRTKPGLVFDFEADLEGIQEAYAAMDVRRAIKSLLRVSTR
jgi:hypothetical protein